MIKIDKNIPLPDNLEFNTNGKYPWHKMQIGDSILVDSRHAASAAKQWSGRNHPERQFSCHYQPNERKY